MQKSRLQDVNIVSFWFTDRMCKRATTQNLKVRIQICRLQKTSGWTWSFWDSHGILLPKLEENIICLLIKWVHKSLKCDQAGEVECGKRYEARLIHLEWIKSHLMRQMGKSSGTSGHTCRAAGELLESCIRQVGNAWWMLSCHWQLQLTHQPEGNCRDRLQVPPRALKKEKFLVFFGRIWACLMLKYISILLNWKVKGTTLLDTEILLSVSSNCFKSPSNC